MRAPASSAASATSGLARVDRDRGRRCSWPAPRINGRGAGDLQSSTEHLPSAPGRVDSPPTSSTWAPWRHELVPRHPPPLRRPADPRRRTRSVRRPRTSRGSRSAPPTIDHPIIVEAEDRQQRPRGPPSSGTGSGSGRSSPVKVSRSESSVGVVFVGERRLAGLHGREEAGGAASPSIKQLEVAALEGLADSSRASAETIELRRGSRTSMRLGARSYCVGEDAVDLVVDLLRLASRCTRLRCTKSRPRKTSWSSSAEARPGRSSRSCRRRRSCWRAMLGGLLEIVRGAGGRSSPKHQLLGGAAAHGVGDAAR